MSDKIELKDLPEDVRKYIDSYLMQINFNSSKEIELLCDILIYSYTVGVLKGFQDCKNFYKNIL